MIEPSIQIDPFTGHLLVVLGFGPDAVAEHEPGRVWQLEGWGGPWRCIRWTELGPAERPGWVMAEMELEKV